MHHLYTKIPGMKLLFLEYGMSQSMAFRCKVLTSSYSRPGQYLNLNPKWERTFPSVVNFSWDI